MSAKEMSPSAKSPGTTIIVVGPPPESLGGMATVVGQMLAFDFARRYRIELLPLTLAQSPLEPLYGRIARHIRQAWSLRAAIRRTNASIVHIHTCSGFSFYRSVVDMMIGQRLGCRVVLHVHGAKFDEFHAREPVWRRRLVAWSLTRADRVVALSSRWRDKLQHMAPKARVDTVENAVEIPSVAPKQKQNGPCRFALLARMDEWKGIDDLLDACTYLRRQKVAVEVVLAGPSGTAGNATVLYEKIRTRNLASMVRYAGPVHGEAKSNLLAAADAYVQPSHHEGMPIALLEALAYELPVVATRVGAVPEVVSDERHGLLVPPRRPDLLAHAMRRLATEDQNRRDMSCAARALAAQRFSLARFQRDLTSLYD
ncbi:MAG: glycosyltransferase family 4 protein, partial [Phycisphaerales bacterium]